MLLFFSSTWSYTGTPIHFQIIHQAAYRSVYLRACSRNDVLHLFLLSLPLQAEKRRSWCSSWFEHFNSRVSVSLLLTRRHIRWIGPCYLGFGNWNIRFQTILLSFSLVFWPQKPGSISKRAQRDKPSQHTHNTHTHKNRPLSLTV